MLMVQYKNEAVRVIAYDQARGIICIEHAGGSRSLLYYNNNECDFHNKYITSAIFMARAMALRSVSDAEYRVMPIINNPITPPAPTRPVEGVWTTTATVGAPITYRINTIGAEEAWGFAEQAAQATAPQMLGRRVATPVAGATMRKIAAVDDSELVEFD